MFYFHLFFSEFDEAWRQLSWPEIRRCLYQIQTPVFWLQVHLKWVSWLSSCGGWFVSLKSESYFCSWLGNSWLLAFELKVSGAWGFTSTWFSRLPKREIFSCSSEYVNVQCWCGRFLNFYIAYKQHTTRVRYFADIMLFVHVKLIIFFNGNSAVVFFSEFERWPNNMGRYPRNDVKSKWVFRSSDWISHPSYLIFPRSVRVCRRSFSVTPVR